MVGFRRTVELTREAGAVHRARTACDGYIVVMSTPDYEPSNANETLNAGPGHLQPTGGTAGPQFTPSGYQQPPQRVNPVPQYLAPANHPPLTTPSSAPTVKKPMAMRRGFVAAVCAAALIGGGTGAGSFALLSQSDGPAPIAVGAGNAPVSATLDGTVAAAAKAIGPSVVTISVRNGSSGGIGSGIVLDTAGHILTNQHVVGTGSGAEIAVSFADGSTAPATIVGESSETDLAVLAVADDSGVKLASLKPATFAQSGKLDVGQSVVAVGAPLGLSKTVTSGVVSTLNRPVRSGPSGKAVYDAVQTDASINPGNSGGPLVDLDGRVVGINSSIASTSNASQGQGTPGSIGIGFAIPSDLADQVAEQLISQGSAEMASLGVQIAQPEPGTAASESGVTVAEVVPGQAAERAGLQGGDVITQIQGLPMTEVDAVIAAVRSYPVGAEIRVSFTRDGQAREAEVTLGSGS